MHEYYTCMNIVLFHKKLFENDLESRKYSKNQHFKTDVSKNFTFKCLKKHRVNYRKGICYLNNFQIILFYSMEKGLFQMTNPTKL